MVGNFAWPSKVVAFDAAFVHHGVGSEAWSADGFTRLP